MDLIYAIIIFVVFNILLIFGIYILISLCSICVDENFIGRNHCGLVTFNSSGGDIHFNDMTKNELIERLSIDYFTFCDWKPFNKGHVAEYRTIDYKGKVKTIGYITKDKVVFEGCEYKFKREKI